MMRSWNGVQLCVPHPHLILIHLSSLNSLESIDYVRLFDNQFLLTILDSDNCQFSRDD